MTWRPPNPLRSPQLLSQILGKQAFYIKGGGDLRVVAFKDKPETFNWSNPDMARTTYSIELRMDVTNDETGAHMEALVREVARQLYGAAIMTASKYAPELAVTSESSFYGQKDINLEIGND